MIRKLNDYLEEKVLDGLDLKRESVAINMTLPDFKRLEIMFKALNNNVLSINNPDPNIKVFNYNGVMLRIKLGTKTSDFLK